jgi:hypothetical protein
MRPVLKILFLFLAICATFFAYGQKIRFTDQLNSWTIYQVDADPFFIPNYTTSGYSGDTVINSFSYKKYLGPLYEGYIREDTLAGLVYYRGFYCCQDTAEQILYNYNWQVGDSVLHGDFHHYVSDIDSVEINGIVHKVWHVEQAYNFFATTDYYVIEGIGSTHGPTFPVDPMQFEHGFTLTCFHNNGSTPPLSHAVDNFDNVVSCTLGIPGDRLNAQAISVVTDPGNAAVQIKFKQRVPSAAVAIYNAVGQLVFSDVLANVEVYSLTGRLDIPGIYFCNVVEGAKRFSCRFVKQ